MLVHSNSHDVGLCSSGPVHSLVSAIRSGWAVPFVWVQGSAYMGRHVIFSFPPSPGQSEGVSYSTVTLVSRCDVDDMVCDGMYRKEECQMWTCSSSRPTQKRGRLRAAFLPPPPETHADKLSEWKLQPRRIMHSHEHSYGVANFSKICRCVEY